MAARGGRGGRSGTGCKYGTICKDGTGGKREQGVARIDHVLQAALNAQETVILSLISALGLNQRKR